MYNIRRFDHVSPYSTLILGCSLVNYLKFRNSLFVYNLLYCKSPDYIFEDLIVARSTRTKNVTVSKYV